MAPPVDGVANGYLCRYLAGVFDVAASRVQLLRGQTSREKTLVVKSPRCIPALLRPFL